MQNLRSFANRYSSKYQKKIKSLQHYYRLVEPYIGDGKNKQQSIFYFGRLTQ